MNVQPISIKTNFSANNTTKANVTNTNTQQNTTTPEGKSKMKKALPYIAGAAIVAVSAYAFRNKISSILGKGVKEAAKTETTAKDEVKNQVQKEVGEKTTETVKKETAPVAKEKTEEKAVKTPKETPVNTLKGINLKDKKVNSKLENIRNAEQPNIDRIIGENTHNGFVDIPMMNKVATDYIADKNRGANRYHQAADLLEQTHIKAFIKGDDKKKSGVDKFTENILNDKVLFDAYKKMPLKESATRLNNLKETALKSESYDGKVTAEDFFNQAVAKLTEKK